MTDVYTMECYYRQNKDIAGLEWLIVKIKNYNASKYFNHLAVYI